MMNRFINRWACVLALMLGCGAETFAQTIDFGEAIVQAMPKMVKIVGSGGTRGLEAYQSGAMISSQGHVLTVWSYVLDSSTIRVTMHDGLRCEATLVGFDPRLDVAILKIPVADVPFFNLDRLANVEVGDRVLAFSNLYNVATADEPVSVQQGYVSAIPRLQARQGTYDVPYQEEALVIDAMTNNPGAAGGAVTDRAGQLIGVIGKEVRDRRTGSWINFALPIESLRASIEKMLSGNRPLANAQSVSRNPAEPMTVKLLGLTLVPSIVERTPPYIDRVAVGSVADRAGLHADDLIVEINGVMTATADEVGLQLSRIDRDATVVMTVQRRSRFLQRALHLGR